MHLFAPPGVVVGPLALGGFFHSNAKMLGQLATPTFSIEPKLKTFETQQGRDSLSPAPVFGSMSFLRPEPFLRLFESMPEEDDAHRAGDDFRDREAEPDVVQNAA